MSNKADVTGIAMEARQQARDEVQLLLWREHIGLVAQRIGDDRYLASIFSTSSATTRCCSSCEMVASPSPDWTP